MSITDKQLKVERENVRPQRVTQMMRKSVVYQNKGGRGVGRIEATEGKVERHKEESRNPYR
jgi:hypothetical protein